MEVTSSGSVPAENFGTDTNFKESNAGDAIKDEQDAFTSDEDNTSSDFLNHISAAEWTFEGVGKGIERHSLYKRDAFFSTINANGSSESIIETKLTDLASKYNAGCKYIDDAVNEYTQRYSRRIEMEEQAIEHEYIKIGSIESLRPILTVKKLQLEQKKKETIDNIAKTLQELASEKKDVLGKWLTEAETKIKVVQKLFKEAEGSKADVDAFLYEKNKQQNELIKGELEEARDHLKQQHKQVNDRIKEISGEGWNLQTSKRLYWSGMAVAVAAGWLFSIYTLKASFDSSDIAFYLLEGLQKMANKMPGSGFQRIWQLLGVLGIVTALTIVCRYFAVQIRKRSNIKGPDIDKTELTWKLSSEYIRYTQRVNAGNWSIFWFKVLPKLAVLGILIIFLSFYDDYVTKSDELGKSLLGFAIGTTLAIGVGGIVYLYIVKVIDKRGNNAAVKFGSWELATAIGVFFLSLIIMLIYNLMEATPSSSVYFRFNSILLFTAASLVAGFLIGYGLRYKGLMELADELENRIYEYNGYIDRYSGPQRNYPSRKFSDDIAEIINSLVAKIQEHNDNLPKKKLSRTEYVGQKFQGLHTRSPGIVSRVGQWLSDLFFGPQAFNNSPRRKQPVLSDYDEKPEGWESHFMLDLTSKLEAYERELSYVEKELAIVGFDLNNLDNVKLPPLLYIYARMTKSRDRVKNWYRQIDKANIARIKGLSALKLRYDTAVVEVKEGYNVALWYTSNELQQAKKIKIESET